MPHELINKGLSYAGQAYVYVRSLPARYHKLKFGTKVFIWSLLVFHVVLIGGIIAIGPKPIGEFFTRLAASLVSLGFGGYVLVGLMIALATTPPFFGFASALTFCGFTYGLFPGVLIAFTATLAGSSFAFFTYRYLLKDQFRGVMGNKSGRGREGGKYEAFQAVVRSKSLGLLIALRWCPLPFAISNAWYATMDGVPFKHFFIATVCMLPKTVIVVFIGARLDSLAEGGESDGLSKALNIGSMVLASSVSFFTGYYIYHQILKQISSMPALIPDPLLESSEEGAIRIGEGESLLFSPLGSERHSSSEEDEDDLEGEVLQGVGRNANGGRRK